MVDNEKERDVSKKKNRNVYFFVAYSRYFSASIYRVIDRLKKSFNLSWMIVQISYHRFNNLAELLHGDLAAKIGQVIFSKDLMDRKCNCSLPSNINGKCVYEGKFRPRIIIYEVKCSMCDAIYIGNTQQTFKKNNWMVISPIYNVYSRTDKNKTHLLPTLYSTLTLPRHVRIYVSI